MANQDSDHATPPDQNADELGRRLSTEDAEKALYSEKFQDLRDAVERLYVFNNMSGRLLFARNWPDIADLLFDQQLQAYDQEGAASDEDKKKRATLEEEAEDRRLDLLTTFEYMDKELLKEGTVDLEKLEFLMNKFDRNICLHFFSERFVYRFHEAPEAPETDDNETEKQEEQDPQPGPKPDLQNIADAPTGNVNLPPPASQSLENTIKEFQSIQRTTITEPQPKKRSGGHIGHADHSLSQTLTKNQHEETDIFSENFEDPLDAVQPINVEQEKEGKADTNPPIADILSEQDAPSAPSEPEPQTQAAQPQPSDPPENAPHPPAQEPDAASPIKPIAPKPTLAQEDAMQGRQDQGWQPGPPEIKDTGSNSDAEEEDDKPLFVANLERDQYTDAGSTPSTPQPESSEEQETPSSDARPHPEEENTQKSETDNPPPPGEEKP